MLYYYDSEHPQKWHLTMFLFVVLYTLQKSHKSISAALCHHYLIASVEELGQGQLAMLMKPLMAANSGYGNVEERRVIYEKAVCADIR